MIQRQQGKIDWTPTHSSVVDEITLNCLLADAAARDRDLAKADVGNAYAKGKRQRPEGAMELPPECQMRDPDGELLCIGLVTPMWGEAPAGFEWGVTLIETITGLAGWRAAEGVGCLYFWEGEIDGVQTDCRMVTITDDFMISECHLSERKVTAKIVAYLRKVFGEVTYEEEPTSFAGVKLARRRPKVRGASNCGALTMTMERKVVEAVRAHVPQLLDGGDLGFELLEGVAFQKTADAMRLAKPAPARLSPDQKQVQQIIGCLKFPEKVMPRLSVALHRLSTIMSSPPPEALAVAKSLLVHAYSRRTEGVTYGGVGLKSPTLQGGISARIDLTQAAPVELCATADATWGGEPLEGGTDTYSTLLTYNGGKVASEIKKIGLIVDSSFEAEAIATGKVGERVEYAREVLRGLGVPQLEPTFVGTDNKASALIGSGQGLPGRSKHCVRRYLAFLQRVQSRVVVLYHIPDEDNPADFLTKWLHRKKLELSVVYSTNQSNAV
jgi:hypothetical protein